MRLRLAFAAAALLLFAPPASMNAQTAVYAQVTGQSNDLGQGNGYFWGPTFGIYQDRHSVALLHVGLDARGSILKRNNTTIGSGLAGVRASLVPHILPVKVYAEALGGASFSTTNSFQYQVNGGVEYTLLPHIDWRVVEVAYNGYSGGNSGNPVGLSSGIVFRLF